ncbi:MAG: DUF1232 domain-containing protein [Planctomycetes bacterium]|nr:DUF1232 domain-containing protein [Planctomycetota bacterium]
MTEAKDPEAGKAFEKARKYASQPGRALDLVDRASRKAEKHSKALARVMEDLSILFRLVKAWATGRYRQVPVRSIVLAIGAIVYFVGPIDAIPDWIVALGYLDDAAVIGWVVHSIREDLADFRAGEGRA